jgi:hypothetical protein
MKSNIPYVVMILLIAVGVSCKKATVPTPSPAPANTNNNTTTPTGYFITIKDSTAGTAKFTMDKLLPFVQGVIDPNGGCDVPAFFGDGTTSATLHFELPNTKVIFDSLITSTAQISPTDSIVLLFGNPTIPSNSKRKSIGLKVDYQGGITYQSLGTPTTTTYRNVVSSIAYAGYDVNNQKSYNVKGSFVISCANGATKHIFVGSYYVCIEVY